MITKKNKKEKKVLVNLIFIFFLVISVFLIYKNIEIYKQQKRVAPRIDHLKARIIELEEEKDFLEKGISEKQKEFFIEREARDNLNLQREGEKAVAFIFPEIEEEEEEEEEKSWWEKFKERF